MLQFSNSNRFANHLHRGFSDGKAHNTDAINLRTAILKTTIDQLIAEEQQLDQQCRHMRMELEQTQRNPENTYYAYVTRDDLIDCFGDNVVLTLRNFDFYETDAAGALAQQLTVVSANQTPVDVRLVTQQGTVFGQPQSAASAAVVADALLNSGSGKRSPSPDVVDRLGEDTAASTAFLLSGRLLRQRKRLRRNFGRQRRLCDEDDGEDDDDDDGSSSESR